MAGSGKNKLQREYPSNSKRQAERSPSTQSMPKDKKSSGLNFGNLQAGRQSLHDI